MQPAVVIFDFDGTLTSRDSFLDFCIRYCCERPARLLFVLVLLPLAVLLLLGRSAGAAGSVLLWAMTLGSSTRSFVLALRSYAKSTLPRYAHASIFNELAQHVADGSRVVIATGSLPILAHGLLAARQLGRLPVVGTRLRRKWGGLVAPTHCVGQVKVAELSRRFGITAWTSVYTNSFADCALMRGVSSITLVDPSASTLRRTTQLAAKTTPLRILRPARPGEPLGGT